MVKISNQGLIPDDRHLTAGLTSYIAYNLGKTEEESKQLANYTQMLRSRINQIDNRFIDIFYEKDVRMNFSMLQEAQNMELFNSFDASIKLAYMGMTIGKMNLTTLLPDDPKIDFS